MSYDNISEIKRIYEYYINNISAKGHAASLELSLFLYTFCTLNKPRRIVDLGSGFTSYTLRLYAESNPEVVVFSVDDNEKWLETTRNFLNSQNLSTENLLSWDTFQTFNATFDLVLYDLGLIPTRIKEMKKVFSKVSQSGTLILDDAHWDKNHWSAKNPNDISSTLRETMENNLKEFGFNYIILHETLDTYGRYALAANRI